MMNHTGHETGSDWAAVVNLKKVEDEWKVQRYHIIVVSPLLLEEESLGSGVS